MILATLEPEVDDIQHVREFAINRGLQITPQTQLVVATHGFQPFLNELRVPVSYTNESVAVHDVCLYLVDERGGVVRRHQFVIWDVESIIGDIERLHREMK